MADIPTVGMKDTATRIIETLAESMDFQRRDVAGQWQAASTDVMVHRQPGGSVHTRKPSGVDVEGYYSCFTGCNADILPGDRTVLDGTWCLITQLLDRGTHLEFLLEKTPEAAE